MKKQYRVKKNGLLPQTVSRYKGSEKHKKKIHRIKNLLLFGLYLAAVVLIVQIANGKIVKKAYADKAAVHEDTKTVSAETIKEELTVKYYSEYIGNREIASLMHNYAKKYSIDASLLIALAKTESAFDPNAINYNTNGSIDRGICQLNNRTFVDLPLKSFFNPEINIAHAAEFLKWCFTTAEENEVKALAFYNAGIGNVTNKKVGESTLNYIYKIINEKKLIDENLRAYLNKNDYLYQNK